MKIKSIARIITLALPLSIAWAGEASILLIGGVRNANSESVTIADGAKAIVKASGGEVKVSADEITFDLGKNLLVCVGTAVVSAAGSTISGRDIKIGFGDTAMRLHVLNSAGNLHLTKKPGFESWKPDSRFLPSFTDRLPSVELELKRRTRR